MALEHLLTLLERQAAAQADAALAAARERAERIKADAATRLEQRRATAASARADELRKATEREVAAAQRRARHAVLEARQRLLDRVFEAAAAELPKAARRPEFLERLPLDVAEARSYLGDGAATVRCHPDLAPAVQQVVAADSRLTVVADPAAGSGVRLVSEDGSVEVDHTLEARLAQLRPQLALDVLHMLEKPA